VKYVLDTCSYVWLVDDQTKLSSVALSAISNASHSLHISAITVTEVHRLVRRGKISIHAPNGLEDWVS
jgi:PIN domain nuclease of toxin-antitoxin system